MRLGAKIFLTSTLLIATLVGVAAWSLLAMQRLVAVNRGILTETLPALQAALGVRESLPALVRLETRYVVLGDREYYALWTRRMRSVTEELDRLVGLVKTDEERRRLAELRAGLAVYRALVERERARAGDDGARALYEQVVQEYPESAWAPQTLFRLARLEVSPESPLRNYRQAHDHFDRLVKDYPDSPYAADAQAWRDTLGQLLAREQEAARIRQDMERLKRVERRLEQEKRPDPEEAPR